MSDLFLQGVNLAIYGMGSVFVFLTMLVGVTTLMSKLCGDVPAVPVTVTPTVDSPDPHLLAAISAAVTAYRRPRQ
jgi:oxaloacetate decarboxylase gamma subunit